MLYIRDSIQSNLMHGFIMELVSWHGQSTTTGALYFKQRFGHCEHRQKTKSFSEQNFLESFRQQVRPELLPAATNC